MMPNALQFWRPLRRRSSPPVSVIGSRRAFCVLFCERKEGTTIASDSHLRGDTMLNISTTH